MASHVNQIPELQDAEVKLAQAAHAYVDRAHAVRKSQVGEAAGVEWMALCKAATLYEKARVKRLRDEKKNDGNIYR